MTINIQPDFSLKHHNTFGFDQKAEFFCAVHDDSELELAVSHARHNNLDITILGGGSNVVLTKDVSGLLIHLAYQHVDYRSSEQSNATMVYAGAGLDWNELVLQTLAKGLRGLENLTLIPGTVGAAPVQNIGAYGIEVGQRIVSVRAYQLSTGKWLEFTPEQCHFSYRNSFFKQRPNEFVITEVRFELGDCHPLSHEYDSLRKHLKAQHIHTPTAVQISDAVASIRTARLPDPRIIGNAGSFFHNPIIPNEQAELLRSKFANLPVFPNGEDHSKLSAAWLIDKAGFKGMRIGDVGVYDKQALVLVNHGNGDGKELLELARQIQSSIKQQYDIDLQIEPTVI